MAHIIISATASNNIARIEKFYSDSSVAVRAIAAIFASLKTLVTLPNAGRPVNDRRGKRELVILFGGQGFIALYIYNQSTDEVIVYAIRHQREAGYRQNVTTPEQ